MLTIVSQIQNSLRDAVDLLYYNLYDWRDKTNKNLYISIDISMFVLKIDKFNIYFI